MSSEKITLPSSSQDSLLPSPSPAPPKAKKSSSLLSLPRLLALSSLAAYLVYSGYSSSSLSLFASEAEISVESSSVGTSCFQPESPPLKKGQEGRSDVFWTEEFKKLEVERFLGAIRIPTETFDDMVAAPVDGENYDPRWNPFLDFHRYLEETFPLVYERAELETTNRFSLIYTFEGSQPDLKPLVLAAHQDVVPAQTSLGRWTYPPYKGVFDGEKVFGRGASDCKNSLIGILAALEHLIGGGWDNRRTVVLAFGFDEEIGGPQGAFSIGPELLKTYGKDGVALLIDEGGSGISREYGKTLVLPGTGEKGNVSPTILVETAGGHSSTPSVHTSIGLLSRVVVAVEDALLFPPTLTPASPIFGYLQCIKEHGRKSLVPSWLTDGLGGKLTQKKLDKLAASYAEVAGRMGGEFLVRTSKAATLLIGGHKVNALPESASVVFNSRIDFAQTPEIVLDLYAGPVIPIAKQYNLTLISHDGSVLVKGSEGTITLGSQQEGLDPAPVTPLKGKAFEVFLSASRRVFGKEGEGEVIVAPSAAGGNTDTKHYWDLTKNIYRFVPRRVNTSFFAHTVDESLLFETHLEGVAWFHELILFFDDVEGDEGF